MTGDIVQRCIDAARAHGAVSAGVRLVDSIKEVDADGRVIASKPREGIWCVQTPQVFRLGLLRRAHATGSPDASDDASLVETLAPVYMVEGARTNIKITTPDDLALAEAILMQRSNAQ